MTTGKRFQMTGNLPLGGKNHELTSDAMKTPYINKNNAVLYNFIGKSDRLKTTLFATRRI